MSLPQFISAGRRRPRLPPSLTPQMDLAPESIRFYLRTRHETRPSPGGTIPEGNRFIGLPLQLSFAWNRADAASQQKARTFRPAPDSTPSLSRVAGHFRWSPSLTWAVSHFLRSPSICNFIDAAAPRSRRALTGRQRHSYLAGNSLSSPGHHSLVSDGCRESDKRMNPREDAVRRHPAGRVNVTC